MAIKCLTQPFYFKACTKESEQARHEYQSASRHQQDVGSWAPVPEDV